MLEAMLIAIYVLIAAAVVARFVNAWLHGYLDELDEFMTRLDRENHHG